MEKIMDQNLAIRITAILGFLAVSLGAFGAHGLEKKLMANDTQKIWHTAVEYHFYHVLALMFLCCRETTPKTTFWIFALGIVIFSGSLYVLALTNVRWLGAITPIGGLLFLIGWASLAFIALPKK